MGIFTTPAGPFSYAFSPTFPSVLFIAISTGGSADYTFDPLFAIRATVKGSVGGATFQRSGRNFTIRHHSIPTLKLTTRRRSAMQLFRANITRYQQTTQVQRDTWQNEKQLYPRISSAGTLRIPNRYHLFLSSNQNWTYSNVIHNPNIGTLAPSQILTLNESTLNFLSSNLFFLFAPTVVPSGFHLQVYMTRALNEASPSLSKARPRLIKVYNAGASLNDNSFSDYSAAWGTKIKPTGYVSIVNVFLVPIITGQKVLQAQNIVIVS